MSVALSCPVRRQSSHYLPAEALPCWCEVCPVAAGSALLLRSLPCCHGLHSATESLCCSRLPQQQQAASAMGVYLSRGGLPGNVGRPSTTELQPQGTPPRRAFEIAVLFVPVRYPKHCHPGISWAGSLSKSRSVSSSALPSLRLLAQQGTWTSALCAGRCVALPQHGPPPHQLPAAPAKTSAWSPTSPLYLGISLFCGQQRSVWKCGPDSPTPRIDREHQSWVVLTAPSSLLKYFVEIYLCPPCSKNLKLFTK